MRGIQSDINKLIEKFIDVRIKEISLKCDKGNEIININEQIRKEQKEDIKSKSIKKYIPKDEKKLTNYSTFIKDAHGIINNKPNLDFLGENTVLKLKSLKKMVPKDRLRELSNIWKHLDIRTKDKYKILCENKDFTNAKYNEVVGRKTPKQIRKKK